MKGHQRFRRCLAVDLRNAYLNVVHDLPALRAGIEALGGRLVDCEEGDDIEETFVVYTNMASASAPSPNAITLMHLESCIKQRAWLDPSTSAFFRVVHAPKAGVPNGAMAGVLVTPTGEFGRGMHTCI